MHGLLYSVSAVFLSPFNWIVILFFLSFFLKQSERKTCRIISIFIFLIFSNKFILNWYARKWQPLPVSIPAGTTYSCGIVLGGFASPDATGEGFFNETCDRFIQTAKLYKLGNISHILVSGGNGKSDDKDLREGGWVKGQLVMMGIPYSAIFVEDLSNNTSDNAAFTKSLLDSVKLPPPYLLITSAQHIPRASLLFKHAGVATTPYPCNYHEGRSGFSASDLMPKPSILSEWNGYLKEAAGYWFYYLKGSKT